MSLFASTFITGERVQDLHREFIDHITIPSKKGKGVLKRVDEVLLFSLRRLL